MSDIKGVDFDYVSCEWCSHSIKSYQTNNDQIPYRPTYYFCCKEHKPLTLERYHEIYPHLIGDCFNPNEEFLKKFELFDDNWRK
jgi:hypothetical protein